MKSKFPNSIYPKSIPVIEISCVEKVYLVAISNREKFDDILLNQEEGSYKKLIK